MSLAALDFHGDTLREQLSSRGVFTENAIIDPSESHIEIWGIFDETSSTGNKDNANVYQRKDGARFIVDSISFELKVYENMQIYFPRSDKNFKIMEVHKDTHGVQAIWLV